MLTACAGSPKPAKVDPIKVTTDVKAAVEPLARVDAQPDPKFLEGCAEPVDLRGLQGLNSGPAERYWIADRKSLVECAEKKNGVQEYLLDLMQRLSTPARP